MLRITEDDAHGCFILEPSGTLTREDFDALTRKFDAKVGAGGPVPNLVIHAVSFPGWHDFGAFLEHMRFLREHQRKIARIALVSNAGILDIAPKIASHFVEARLRHFPASDLEAALAWVASREEEPPHVVLIEGLPEDTIGISVQGIVSARDYDEIIIPAVEARLATHEKLKVLYRVPAAFGFTPGALWSDTRLGVTRLTRFSKVAVVTDIDWVRGAARVFAPLIPAEVHVFRDRELEDAKTWLAA